MGEGLGVGGLAVVADRSIDGITVGGLAVVSGGGIRGSGMSLGKVHAEDEIYGFAVGGYMVEAIDFRGVSLGLVRTKMEEMRGFAVSGYNQVTLEQRGLTIGIYNRARELHGVQIGLLNYAGNNPPGLRWLPIINLNLN